MTHIPITYPELYNKRNISASVIEVQVDLPEASVISIEEIDIESQIQPYELIAQNIDIPPPIESQQTYQNYVINREHYVQTPFRLCELEERNKKHVKCVCSVIFFTLTFFCFALIIVAVANE